MIFHDVSGTEEFPILRRVSEGGRWELGLVPMLFGVRVRAGLVGDYGVAVDYCAGADRTVQLLLLRMVQTILEGQPESVTDHQVYLLMPGYQVKPINRDPECWNALIELAARSAAVPVSQ